jgi:hypothetical protein
VPDIVLFWVDEPETPVIGDQHLDQLHFRADAEVAGLNRQFELGQGTGRQLPAVALPNREIASETFSDRNLAVSSWISIQNSSG